MVSKLPFFRSPSLIARVPCPSRSDSTRQSYRVYIQNFDGASQRLDACFDSHFSTNFVFIFPCSYRVHRTTICWLWHNHWQQTQYHDVRYIINFATSKVIIDFIPCMLFLYQNFETWPIFSGLNEVRTWYANSGCYNPAIQKWPIWWRPGRLIVKIPLKATWKT